MSREPQFGVDGKEGLREGSVVDSSLKVCCWRPLTQGGFCWPYVTLDLPLSAPVFPSQIGCFEEMVPEVVSKSEAMWRNYDR